MLLQLKDVLTAEVKNYLNILLEPDPLKRKTLEELWQDPWIQRASNAELVAGGGLTTSKKPEPTSVSLPPSKSPQLSATDPPSKEIPEKSTKAASAVRNEPTGALEIQSVDMHEEVKAPLTAVPPETMRISPDHSKDDLQRLKSNVQITTDTYVPAETKLEFKRTRSQVNIARRLSSPSKLAAKKSNAVTSAASGTSHHSQSEQK